MKNILFLFSMLSSALFAQQNDKKWDKVIACENEGKIKSASKIVDQIYRKAIDKKNEVQLIKCFFYQSKYLQILEEDAQTKILSNLKTDINRVSIPSKAILNLVYAKCLNKYLDRNIYNIRSRTNTTFLDNNFLTWTENNFTEQIDTSLKETLENEAILKTISLTNYQDIFDFLTLEKLNSENLYDYLVKENIDFFNQKIQRWEIQNSEILLYKDTLLGNSEAFTKLDLSFIKEENFNKALSLYQKLELNNPSIENQFNRIIFCSDFIPQYDDNLIKSLNELQQRSNDKIITQKILFKKADILLAQASKEFHPDYNTEAIKIYDTIININAKTNTAQNALQQKHDVMSKSLTVQLQKYSYNNENTRAFIDYKNIDRLNISFYKIDLKKLKKFTDSEFEYKQDSLGKAIIKNQNKITSKEYQLQNKNDYFEYSTEVMLPQLETGNYLVYFESDSDLKDKKAFAFETITISNLSILTSQENNKENFQVLDRKSGKPLENVSIKSSRFKLKTDSNGLASYTRENNYDYNDRIEFSLENDTILPGRNYSQYTQKYKETEDNTLSGKVEFYLDRAIYRPGQTVYYKGIAFQKQKNKSSIVANTSFKITIKDPNYQTYKEFEVTTNEFGSFSGEFVLPQNSVTGSFNIYTQKPEDDTKGDNLKNKPNASFWDNVRYELKNTNVQNLK
jgi:MG2 domain